MITSQFRIDFWIGKIFTFAGGLAMMFFVLYLSYYKDSHFDYRSVWFWIGVLMFLWFWTSLYRFFFDELKTIVVSEAGISVRYMFSEPDKIQFHEIKELELYPVRTVRGKASGISHYKLIITLHDSGTLSFDGYQFKNFSAVKSMIYQYVYHSDPPGGNF